MRLSAQSLESSREKHHGITIDHRCDLDRDRLREQLQNWRSFCGGSHKGQTEARSIVVQAFFRPSKKWKKRASVITYSKKHNHNMTAASVLYVPGVVELPIANNERLCVDGTV